MVGGYTTHSTITCRMYHHESLETFCLRIGINDSLRLYKNIINTRGSSFESRFSRPIFLILRWKTLLLSIRDKGLLIGITNMPNSTQWKLQIIHIKKGRRDGTKTSCNGEL